MLLTLPNCYNKIITSVADGSRPVAAWGTSITPGNNTYGSYASIIAGASVVADVYEIEININSSSTSASARDCLVTIGIDAAGGSSFTDLIPNLLGSCAPTYTVALPGTGGVSYRFPIFIKSGSSIGAKATVNNATVGTLNVAVKLYCLPSRPDLLKVGSFVRDFGTTLAGSNGTAVTPGGAAEGAFTALGSAIADPLLWFWEVGLGCNNAVMAANVIHVDLAIGSSTSTNKIIMLNKWFGTSTNESIGKAYHGEFGFGVNGDNVYARAQSGPSGPDTGFSIVAYGVGG